MSTKPEPRRRIRRLALAAAVLLLVVPTLFPFEMRHDPALWRSAGDLAHVLLMAAITALLHLGWSKRASWRRSLVLGLVATAIAATIEIIQPWFGRSGGLGDLARDLLGIALVTGAVIVWSGRSSIVGRVSYVTLATLVTAIVAWPAWTEWRAVRWRAGHFPVLGAFDDPIELRLWRPNLVRSGERTTLRLTTAEGDANRTVLEVRTGDGAWPGVAYFAGKSDWSRFEALTYSVFNPDKPFRMSIRIDDTERHGFDERFNRGMIVDHGWNHVRIPMEQIRHGPVDGELNVGSITRVVFFVRPGPSRRYLLDDVRLGD